MRTPLPSSGCVFGNWRILGEFQRRGKRQYTYAKVICLCGRVQWRELSLLRSRARLRQPQACMFCRHLGHGKQTVGSYLRAIYKSKCPWLSHAQAEFLAKLNCFYCGTPPQNHTILPRTIVEPLHVIYQGLDEVKYGDGHIIGNVLPCCIACNKAKSNYSLEQFCDWYNRRRSSRYQLSPAKIKAEADRFGWVLRNIG
jgi:hypothetical protein